MSVSKRTRFDVFKRDGFTCTYCGRKPPTVTLEADHILPRAEGGGDEIDNLTTACADCNRGKAAELLDNRAPVRDMGEQAALIREREEQLRAYHEAKAETFERLEEDFDEVWRFWFSLWERDSLNRWEVPWEGVLRNAVNVLGVAEVQYAMQLTRDRFPRPGGAPPRYFGGIIRNKLAAVEAGGG